MCFKVVIVILIIIFSIICFFSFCQSYDIVIDKKIYKAYFCQSLHVPVAVEYKLYKVGGSCKRSGMIFKNDLPQVLCASAKNYLHSGYDEGHMCPAADEVNDCFNLELTFRFYNCVPQFPDLNRNIWLSFERLERNLSQTDSIEVVNVNVITSKKLSGLIGIPDYCIKSIWSLSSHKCIICICCLNALKSQSVRSDVFSCDLKYNVKIERFLTFIPVF
jgi:endonuclease G